MKTPMAVTASWRVSALVLAILAGAACNSAAGSVDAGSPNCTALQACCGSPSLPSSDVSSCINYVTDNGDRACSVALSSFTSAGYCKVDSGSGSSTGGSSGGGSGSGSGSASSSGSGSGGGSGSGSSSGSGSGSSSGSGLIQCPRPDGGCTNGPECIATSDCCQGFYCSCINGDTCNMAATCTLTPNCTILGATCSSSSDCCEPYATACDLVQGASRCCIDPAKQLQHASDIRCYCNADCCPGSTCDTSTGMCQ